MSVFISYNYDAGHEMAAEIDRALLRSGIDAWWLKERLREEQVDGAVERAMAACERCIIVWSGPELSSWQRAEIEAIRLRLMLRHPPADTTDFFMVIRGPDVPKDGHPLPLLGYSEYIEYPKEDDEPLDFSYLVDYAPGARPLFAGGGRSPFLQPLGGSVCSRGQRAFTGSLRDDQTQKEKRFCWVFLEDSERQWYLQAPRPTFTHADRWIAPAVHIGSKISAVVLAAAGHEAHRHLISSVLNAEWGALDRGALGDLQEIDRLALDLDS